MKQIVTLMTDEIEKRLIRLDSMSSDDEAKAKSEKVICDTTETLLEIVKELNRNAESEDKLDIERERLEFEKEKFAFEKEKFDTETLIKQAELENAEIALANEDKRNRKLDKIHLCLDIAKIVVPLGAYCAIAHKGYIMEAGGTFPTYGPLKETIRKIYNYTVK